MIDLKILPLRQKILIGLTILGGLFLIVCSAFSLLPHDNLNTIIFAYGLGIPLTLHISDSFNDLNHKTVFRIWFTIAAVNFLISLTTYKSDKFIIKRSASFDPTVGVNRFIGDYSTSSLKALIVFLVMYWLLNRLLNKRGHYLINTYWKGRWYHEEAQRKITWFDVVANIILFLTIIVASLFGW
jgi:hypothetical protein